MRLDKFTQKSQEAILEAQTLAQAYNHPAVEPEHLLKTLIEQEGGVVPSLLKRVGTDVHMLQGSVEQALGRMSRATGSSVQVGMSRELSNILEEAQSIADSMKDDYVSTEHLLMAMAQPKGGLAKCVKISAPFVPAALTDASTSLHTG